jgi:UDP-N-acetylmuramate: L-alanyl-gamma-D-glutamyl-meso-diaminopimelate ligase
MLAAHHAGVPWEVSRDALADFRGVRRRLEVRGRVNDITIIDDFAHHPTAIAATLNALADRGDYRRLLAVLEPRSNSMQRGSHREQLPASLQAADAIFCLDPAGLTWPMSQALAPLGERARCEPTVAALIGAVRATAAPGDAVVVMSNGGFEGIHERLLTALDAG